MIVVRYNGWGLYLVATIFIKAKDKKGRLRISNPPLFL